MAIPREGHSFHLFPFPPPPHWSSYFLEKTEATRRAHLYTDTPTCICASMFCLASCYQEHVVCPVFKANPFLRLHTPSLKEMTLLSPMSSVLSLSTSSSSPAYKHAICFAFLISWPHMPYQIFPHFFAPLQNSQVVYATHCFLWVLFSHFLLRFSNQDVVPKTQEPGTSKLLTQSTVHPHLTWHICKFDRDKQALHLKALS